ncbi:MAG: hypothetical protein Q8N05_19470, partial [Bacteroidota bacterium]|nr:hypothetical protein [Bacteroidota bacterium]
MNRRNFIKNGVMASGGAFLISGTYSFGASTFHPLFGKEPLKINPYLLNNKWDAEWIACPEVSLLDYGVFHYRKTISIRKKTKEFIVHVSGDNRYRLFVNGTEVCNGPARSDLLHWCFESIDIAEWLIPGK